MLDYQKKIETISEQIYKIKKTINLYKMLIEIVLDTEYDPQTHTFTEFGEKDLVFYSGNKIEAERDLNKLRKKREIILSQKEISEALSDTDVLSLYEAFSNQGSQTKNFTYLNDKDRKYLISLLRDKLSKVHFTKEKIDLDANPKVNFFVN